MQCNTFVWWLIEQVNATFPANEKQEKRQKERGRVKSHPVFYKNHDNYIKSVSAQNHLMCKIATEACLYATNMTPGVLLSRSWEVRPTGIHKFSVGPDSVLEFDLTDHFYTRLFRLSQKLLFFSGELSMIIWTVMSLHVQFFFQYLSAHATIILSVIVCCVFCLSFNRQKWKNEIMKNAHHSFSETKVNVYLSYKKCS